MIHKMSSLSSSSAISALEARISASEARIFASEEESQEYDARLASAQDEEARKSWAGLLTASKIELAASKNELTETRRTLNILLQHLNKGPGKQPSTLPTTSCLSPYPSCFL